MLAGNSGTENVVELLADALRSAGHDTMIFAPTIGEQAKRMAYRGHRVYDRISQIHDRPDVIHAHHISACFIAMAKFPDTPVVYTCHSAFFEIEAPLFHPQIKRWVGVDEACEDKCLARGVPEAQLSVILNSVDPARFKMRDALPEKPQRALLLTKNTAHLQSVRDACSTFNLQLDELGPAVGKVSTNLANELLGYDIVFATARMALEAAFVGCAVVVCDERGFAGYLASSNVKDWRKNNFGVRLLRRPTTRALITEAIEKYDAADAFKVTAHLRETASTDDYVAAYTSVYEAAIRLASTIDPVQIADANARWMEELIVTGEERIWYKIASEMCWMPRYESEYSRMSENISALVSHSDEATKTISALSSRTALIVESLSAAAAQTNHAVAQIDFLSRQTSDLSNELNAIQDHTAKSYNILFNLKLAYQTLVPSIFRRMNAVRRQRISREKD
ncbi:glycosyltransferase [Phyllobacterium sp. 628]|uniref:glycosyltransferase n=1 Tax=Phyllobacterium sp. 628 TaxID=2718938 RepID=UPI002113500D|nr:glycosyltransferase family 4 protein [Phyllobacterium sp. 628]